MGRIWRNQSLPPSALARDLIGGQSEVHHGAKLAEIAATHGVARWTTNLAAALKNANDTIYFDAQLTGLRAGGAEAAIAVGKHVYCEKPIAA